MPTSEQDVRELAIRTRDEASRITVVDDPTFVAAGELLREIKVRRSRIAEVLDPIIAAAHKAHKVALDGKKTAEAPLVEADKYLRGQLSTYKAKQDEAIAREALALARTGEISLPREAAKVEGIGFTKRWAFEVVDPDAVPREFLVVDESKIRKHVEALGESANLPGVRVWQYDSPNVR